MLFFANRRAAATTVAVLTAGAQPIRVGKHGIAPLAAHFAGRAQPVGRAADDIAVLLPAVAESGPPTIVQLTHANLISNKALTGQGLLGVEHHDVVMACLPLFEGFGMTCALAAAMSAGATLVLPRGFTLGPRWKRSPPNASPCSRACRACTRRCCGSPMRRMWRSIRFGSASRWARRQQRRFCAVSRTGSAASCWRGMDCRRSRRWPP